jgi:hypothetical protein
VSAAPAVTTSSTILAAARRSRSAGPTVRIAWSSRTPGISLLGFRVGITPTARRFAFDDLDLHQLRAADRIGGQQRVIATGVLDRLCNLLGRSFVFVDKVHDVCCTHRLLRISP